VSLFFRNLHVNETKEKPETSEKSSEFQEEKEKGAT